MKKLYLVLFCVLTSFSRLNPVWAKPIEGLGASLDNPRVNNQRVITSVAIGSCAREPEPQPIWTLIGHQQPDVFLFIGDNQYADSWIDENGEYDSAPVQDSKRFNKAYEALAAIPPFAEFREKVPIMGIWDDPDYGKNDGGKEYVQKAASQAALVEFFGFPDPLSIQSQKGIYHSRIIGP